VNITIIIINSQSINEPSDYLLICYNSISRLKNQHLKTDVKFAKSTEERI